MLCGSARAAPDRFQVTCASSHLCAAVSVTGYSRLAASLRESRHGAEMHALLSMGDRAKLRVRALNERWTRACLFLNLSDWLPQIAEAPPAFASLVAWLRPSASHSLTEKLQDVNVVSVFNAMFIDTMFIVLVSQGKSRKSSEKCCTSTRNPAAP
jgi:hypothetical protein